MSDKKCIHCKNATATLKNLSGTRWYCLSCAIEVYGYPDWAADTITLTEDEMREAKG